MSRIRPFILVFSVLLGSCLDESEYDIQQVTLTPTMAFPIAFGDMGLVDLLSNKDTAYIRSYPDGLLYLYYAKPFHSTEVRDHFVLPNNISTISFNLPAGTLPASATTTTFGTINGQIDLGLVPERLSEIVMKSGTLARALTLSKTTSPPNLPLEATITLANIVHKGTLQPLVVTMSNGDDTGALDDYIFQLTDNRFSVQVDLSIKPHPATFIPAGTTADVQLAFTEMQFATIKGFFGDQVIPLPSQSLDITVFNSSLKGSTSSFQQPHLSFQAVNDYVVPCELTFSSIRATKGTTHTPLQISPSSPMNLNVPASLGLSATTDVTINNESAVMSTNPEQFEYTTSVRINKGLSSGVNSMADTSKLRLSLVTEIPLYGRVTGITVTDTLDVDLRDVTKTDVTQASLKISAHNEMPLDASVQIYLLGEAYQVLDSIFLNHQTYLVKASEVDGAGDLLQPGITNLTLSLDPARISKLFSSHHLLVRAVMSTARDQNDQLLNVKFRSHYRLKLNFGLLAKLNIRVE